MRIWKEKRPDDPDLVKEQDKAIAAHQAKLKSAGKAFLTKIESLDDLPTTRVADVPLFVPSDSCIVPVVMGGASSTKRVNYEARLDSAADLPLMPFRILRDMIDQGVVDPSKDIFKSIAPVTVDSPHTVSNITSDKVVEMSVTVPTSSGDCSGKISFVILPPSAVGLTTLLIPLPLRYLGTNEGSQSMLDIAARFLPLIGRTMHAANSRPDISALVAVGEEATDPLPSVIPPPVPSAQASVCMFTTNTQIAGTAKIVRAPNIKIGPLKPCIRRNGASDPGSPAVGTTSPPTPGADASTSTIPPAVMSTTTNSTTPSTTTSDRASLSRSEKTRIRLVKQKIKLATPSYTLRALVAVASTVVSCLATQGVNITPVSYHSTGQPVPPAPNIPKTHLDDSCIAQVYSSLYSDPVFCDATPTPPSDSGNVFHFTHSSLSGWTLPDITSTEAFGEPPPEPNTPEEDLYDRMLGTGAFSPAELRASAEERWPWLSARPDLLDKLAQRFAAFGQIHPDGIKDVMIDMRLKPGYSRADLRLTGHPRPIPNRIGQQRAEEAIMAQVNVGAIRRVDDQARIMEGGSPVTFALQKDKTRLCIDFNYSLVNEALESAPYTQPTSYELIGSLPRGFKWFFKLDMSKGYMQCKLTPETSRLLQFVTPLGTFEPLRMPFGPTVSPEIFQRIVDGKFQWHIVNDHLKCYLDDQLSGGTTLDDMFDRLLRVLDTAIEHRIRYDWTKFEMGEELTWLGLGVNKDGTFIPADKTEAFDNVGIPSNLDEFRHAMGLFTFVSDYVPDFAGLTAPFSHLRKKGAPWVWTEDMTAAWNVLKAAVRKGVPLSLPDYSQPFFLFTDANISSIAGFLWNGPVVPQVSDFLRPDGSFMDPPEIFAKLKAMGCRLVRCASRALSSSELNERFWSTTDQECLAIHWCITEKFADELKYGNFTLFTDHSNLVFLRARNSKRVARWLSNLRGYPAFVIRHIPGKLNVMADAATRAPITSPPLPLPHFPIGRATQPGPVTVSAFLTRAQAKATTPATAPPTTAATTPVVDPLSLLVPFSDFPARVLAAQAAASSEEKNLWARSKNVTVKDKVYMIGQSDNGTVKEYILLPPGLLRDTAIAYCHDHVTAGHPDANNTLARIHEMGYSWPGAMTDLQAYVSSCFGCQLFKRRQTANHEPYFAAQPVVTGPNQRVYADILHLGTKAAITGEDKVIVFIDAFDATMVVAPIPDESAESVINAFIERWCAYYLFPAILDSDGGPGFDNDAVRLLAERTRSARHVGTAYNHRGRGRVERMHSSILAKLRVLLNGQAANWKAMLPFVQMAINTQKHSSTGLAPATLRFTAPVRAAGLLLGTPVPSNPSTFPTRLEWLEDRLIHAQELFAQALRTGEREALARARQQDFSRSPPQEDYKIGQWVLYHAEAPDITSHSKSKLVAKWRGPVMITNIILPGDNQPIRYTIFNNRTGQTLCMSAGRLAPCDVSRMPDPPSYNKAGTDVTEGYIEEVLADNGARTTSTLFLRIRWEGWTSEYDTWEPYDCEDGRGVLHVPLVKTYLAEKGIRLEDTGKAPSDASWPPVPAVTVAAPKQTKSKGKAKTVRFEVTTE